MIFAEWLTKQFPKVKTVADIAGGKGDLALWLHRCGYEVTTFDRRCKRLRGLPCHSVTCDVAGVEFRPGEYDLVVGLHPDSATWHVLRLAKEAKAYFAVVPCCVEPPEGMKPDRPWVEWLERQAKGMGFEVYTSMLHMKGMNTVIKGWLPKTA